MKARVCLFVVLGFIVGPTAMAQTPEQKDQLPSPPAGKTWKMVWHDEFDGTQAGRKQMGLKQRREDVGTAGGAARPSSLDGKGHLVMKTLQGGRQVHRRLRRHARASSSTSSATMSLASSFRSSPATGRLSG